MRPKYSIDKLYGQAVEELLNLIQRHIILWPSKSSRDWKL